MLSGKNLLSIIQDEKANIKLEVSGEDLLEFSNDLTNSDKDYFSIGFRNDKGGYELSSPPNSTVYNRSTKYAVSRWSPFKTCKKMMITKNKNGGRPKLSPAEKLKYRIAVNLCTNDLKYRYIKMRGQSRIGRRLRDCINKKKISKIQNTKSFYR